MCECCETNAAQESSFLCWDCERYATVLMEGEEQEKPIPTIQEGIASEVQE